MNVRTLDGAVLPPVLIYDPDHERRAWLAAQLEQQFVVLATGDAPSLCAHLETLAPGLVLLAQTREGALDGLLDFPAPTQACLRVVLTAYGDEAWLEHLLGAGADEVLVLPCSAPLLRRRVALWLAAALQCRQLVAQGGGDQGAAFRVALEAEWRRCRRSGQPLTLLAFVPHGGDGVAGRQALAQLQGVCAGEFCRPGDAIFQLAAGPLVCLLPETGYHGGLHKALVLLKEGAPAIDGLCAAVVSCVPDGARTAEGLRALLVEVLQQAQRSGDDAVLGQIY